MLAFILKTGWGNTPPQSSACWTPFNLGRWEGAFPKLSTAGYSQMLASVCVWLVMPRVCEQREDARVWRTKPESVWSPNSAATFATGLPPSRLQGCHRPGTVSERWQSYFVPRATPQPFLNSLSISRDHSSRLILFPLGSWVAPTACPLLVYLWPFWVLEKTSLGLMSVTLPSFSFLRHERS